MSKTLIYVCIIKVVCWIRKSRSYFYYSFITFVPVHFCLRSMSLIIGARKNDKMIPESLKTLVIQKPLYLDEKTCLKFRYTLTHLCMSDTKLRIVPEFLFSSLPNLSWLDLRTNRLKSIPFCVKDHRKLTTLLLDENIFDSLPPYLALVHSLANVTFRDNIISFPSEEVLNRGWPGIKKYLLQTMEEARKKEKQLARKFRYHHRVQNCILCIEY